VRVGAFAGIQTLRKAADFKAEDFGESCGKWNATAKTATDAKKIASLYVESAELATKVKGRKDAHAYAKDLRVGATLDTAICAAIEAGAKAGAVKANDVGSIQWHSQVVDKSLQQFFYTAVYGYLVAGTRKGYDEGVGYYGRALDGSDDARGIAATVKSRDGNCGTTYAKEIWGLLRQGKDELDKTLKAENKAGNEDKASALSGASLEVAAEVDRRLLNVFALSLGREMVGLGKGETPAIKLVEGRGFFRIVRAYIASKDSKLADELATMLEQDDPAKCDSQKVLAAIKTVFGLDVAAVCAK
jgi:hypothetical protein